MIGHIAQGSHGNNPKVGKCAAEWRYFLCRCTHCTEAKANGTLLTDAPPCAPATLAQAIPVVNDGLTGAGRQRLASRISLIPSVEPDANPDAVLRVERRVALWCARSVEHMTTDTRVRACNDTTERFLAGTATLAELRAGWTVGWAEATAEAAGWAAASAEATGAAEAGATGRASASAAATWAAASWAAAGAEDDVLLDWLDRLLDVWAKIAAEEGLLGSCGWLDPDEFVQVNGS